MVISHRDFVGNLRRRPTDGHARAVLAPAVPINDGAAGLAPPRTAMHEPMLAPAVPINDCSAGPVPPTPSKRATVCRLFGLLSCRELLMILAATAATLIASLLQMALPVLSGWLISAISSDKGYSDSCKQSPSDLSRCRRERLQQVVALMGISFAIAGLTLAVGLWLYMLSGERLVARLRRRLFAAYVHQDIAFYDASKTGDLMNRLASDCTELKTTLTRSLGEGMSNTMQLGVGLSLMLLSSPVLTLITLGAAPIIAVCGAIYGLFVARLSEQYQKALADASDVAQQALSSIRTVRSFANEEWEKHRYNGSVGLSFVIGAKRAAALGAFIGLTSTVAQVALVCVLWYGCLLVLDGKLDLGELTSFLLLAIYTIAALGGMMALFSAIMSALGVSRRIFEQLDAQPRLRLEGGTRLAELRGRIVLESVRFAYPARPDVQVLRGVSLAVEPGKVLALCGASGSGKSSILALLERWYDFDDGAIDVDGVPLRELDPSWWRRQVALVAQEPVLFNGTVLENLCYGCLGQEGTRREEAAAAAKTANADEFIGAFTDGYDTLVGERGVALSGGQKQRIAIARALLAEPRVLLLDEATSALDAESESLVQAAIDRLMEQRTTLVIAHRLSTIRNADCICVMLAGVVAERGSHDELVGLGGVYEGLVQKQMAGSSTDASTTATPVIRRRQQVVG